MEMRGKWLLLHSGYNISTFVAHNDIFLTFNNRCILLLFIKILLRNLSIDLMFQKENNFTKVALLQQMWMSGCVDGH